MGTPDHAQQSMRVWLAWMRDRVFHTYAAYARGSEVLIGAYNYLDLTPFGRQEDWEDSPAGWPQTPTYGWLRHHDRYDG